MTALGAQRLQILVETARPCVSGRTRPQTAGTCVIPDVRFGVRIQFGVGNPDLHVQHLAQRGIRVRGGGHPGK